MSKRIAVYPGSFDPITRGHLDVAKRASRLFDELVVAVAQDADKEHLFSLEERVAMVTDACAGMENVTAEGFEGLLVDYASRRGAVAVVKGLRGPGDFERERQMWGMNRTLAPGLETCYLMALPELEFVGSSLVKHVHQAGGDVSRFVTPLVREMLDRKLGRRRRA